MLRTPAWHLVSFQLHYISTNEPSKIHQHTAYSTSTSSLVSCTCSAFSCTFSMKASESVWNSSSLISAGVRAERSASRLGVLGFSVSGIRPVALEALNAKLLEQLTALMAVGATRHGWRWKALAWRERRTVREAERVAWLSRREAEGADMAEGVVVVLVVLDGRWLMTIEGEVFGQ